MDGTDFHSVVDKEIKWGDKQESSENICTILKCYDVLSITVWSTPITSVKICSPSNIAIWQKE